MTHDPRPTTHDPRPTTHDPRPTTHPSPLLSYQIVRGLVALLCADRARAVNALGLDPIDGLIQDLPPPVHDYMID